MEKAWQQSGKRMIIEGKEEDNRQTQRAPPNKTQLNVNRSDNRSKYRRYHNQCAAQNSARRARARGSTKMDRGFSLARWRRIMCCGRRAAPQKNIINSTFAAPPAAKMAANQMDNSMYQIIRANSTNCVAHAARAHCKHSDKTLARRRAPRRKRTRSYSASNINIVNDAQRRARARARAYAATVPRFAAARVPALQRQVKATEEGRR